MRRRIWQWDETLQVGTDYERLEEVRAYDRRMSELRDVPAECARILGKLAVSDGDTILEVGTGTGAFARAAARRCCRVIALDVSPVMLAYAEQRAREDGIHTIEFHQAGFLTYDHDGPPVAAVVSQLALHHLPDLWKLVALRRMAALLQPTGRLFVSDVVFGPKAEADPEGFFDALVAALPTSSQAEMARHLRQEFSTYDWVMAELLRRAGFSIQEVETERGFLAHYLCRRVAPEPGEPGAPAAG